MNIHLVLPSSVHRPCVTDFVTQQYAKRMSVIPPLPDILFAAIDEGKCIGTIGLEFSDTDGNPIPCEHIFAFNPSQLQMPVPRTASAQYSRWTVTDPNVARKIAYTATTYAIAQGKECGWCELKPQVARRMQLLGIVLHEVKGASIQLDRVDDSVRQYYCSKPYPKLYQIDLAQTVKALQ